MHDHFDHPLEEAAAVCGVPEGATPLAATLLFEYLDSNGEACLGMRHLGDASYTARQGLLTWASLTMHDTYRDGSYDAEEDEG